MAKILAIETSGATLSVAAAADGRLICEVFRDKGLNHSDKLIPVLKIVLKKARWRLKSINKIAVSTGPGSFTGIRVGLSCARALAQNLGIPLCGVTSLELLKAGAENGKCAVIPAIDALRGEVFTADARTGKPVIENAGEFVKRLKKINKGVCVPGSAAVAYFSEMSRKPGGKIIFGCDGMNHPRAGVLALLAEKKKGVKYDKVKPLYIRRSWAEEKRR